MGTALFRRSKRDGDKLAFRIANSTAVAVGEYAVLNTGGFLTTPADTAGFIPLGFITGFSDLDTANGTDTGDTSATPPPEAFVDVDGGAVKLTALTGAAGTVADVGLKIYVTGVNTFTLTETTNLPAVGEVVRSASTSDIDVYFYPMSVMQAAQATIRRRSQFVGRIGLPMLGGTAALSLHRHTMRDSGAIRRLYARPDGFSANVSAGSQTITLLIGSTTVTMSANLILREANIDASGDVGTDIAAGAITANNVFSAGQIVVVRKAVSGSAFNQATNEYVGFDVWIDVDEHPIAGNRS